MGYYSFYKIIKDIFRTIFDNKILKFTFVFLLIFFILFLFNKNKVSAVSSPTIVSSFNITNPNNNNQISVNLPNWIDDYYWAFLYKNYSSSYIGFIFYVSQTPITISYSSNGQPTVYGNKITVVSGGTPSWNSVTNVLVNNPEPNFNNVITTSLVVGGNAYQSGKTMYCACNHDIKNNTTGDIIYSDTVYTFVPPQFDNVSEIENGNPNGVYISRHDFHEDDNLYFHLLEITYTVVDGNNTVYYYSPKIFELNKTSEYYRTWEGDTDNNLSYYYIPRYKLGLNPNSSYLYLLSSSGDSFTNSYGILQVDISSGIYDIIQSDTKGVITSQDSMNDKIQNIDDTLNQNTISDSTETDINNSLDFDNQNEDLNNLNGGFFSRLTSMLSKLLGYNLGDDTSVIIPLPNSNKSITLHSKDIYDNVTGAIRLIINAFWVYVFSYYMWKFINKIYIAVSTGNILDTFSSSGEAITNDML